MKINVELYAHQVEDEYDKQKLITKYKKYKNDLYKYIF